MTLDASSPPFDLEAVLRDAAARAVMDEDPAGFVAWLSERLPMYWLAPEPPGPGMAALLARSIWNAMPLPGNDLRPRPLEPPARNAPCPCGSGRKYKQCCRDVDAKAPELPVAMLYPYIAAQLRSADIERLLASPQVPVDFALVLADRAEEDSQWLKAARSLEPLFRQGASFKRTNLDLALSRLVDCYNALGHTKKKQRLLDRVIAEAPACAVRGEAWSRRAAIALDGGDREQAHKAFQQAQRDAPNDPSHGPREIVMLLSNGELAQARERAEFWRRRLERDGYDLGEAPLNLVAEAVHDPEGAMLTLGDQHTGVDSGALRRWVADLASQPLEAATVKRIDDGADSGEAPEGILEPGAAVARVEAAWSDGLDAMASDDLRVWWEDDRWPRVIEWLQARPPAASSFRVLDDLLSAAQSHPGAASSPAGIDALCRPLLERAVDLLATATRAAPDVTLPWGALENRPALYALVELAFLEQRTGNRARARDLFAWLVGLNPNDNHGIRGELITLYLELDENEQALRLAAAYPDDLLAATRFGRVLALYRLGHKHEAREAARAAHAAMPLVRDYLVRKRVREPAMDDFGFSVGGADQAWLYRDQARPVWAQTPGALSWLQRTLPSGH